MTNIILKITIGNSQWPTVLWEKFIQLNDLSLVSWYCHGLDDHSYIKDEIQTLLDPYSAKLDVENDQLIFETEADKLEFLIPSASLLGL